MPMLAPQGTVAGKTLSQLVGERRRLRADSTSRRDGARRRRSRVSHTAATGGDAGRLAMGDDAEHRHSFGLHDVRWSLPGALASLVCGLVMAHVLPLVAADDPSLRGARALADGDAASTDQAEGDPWWLYCTIPIVSGLVGWGTNVVALKMTFYPLKFFGWEINRWMCGKHQPVGCIGWQGIVPTKVRIMAGMSVDLMMKELFDMQELFSRLDSRKMTEHMRPGLEEMMHDTLGEVLRDAMPSLWDSLSRPIQEEIVARSIEEVPEFFRKFLDDVTVNLEQVFDVKHMVVEHLATHPEQLNKVFEKCGAEEFVFIERSGFYFGFIFGVFQALLWWIYPEWWILPAAGFLVGYLTNFIALKMIFEPIEPVYLCCGRLKLHGLFLQRQAAVSREFSIINYEQMLNSKKMWDTMLFGKDKDKFFAKLNRHTEDFVETLLGGAKTIVVMYLGADGYRSVKDTIVQRVAEGVPQHIHLIYDYSDEALGMQQELEEKMNSLSYTKFEGVLHPVFQQDEIKLILVGAFLGVAVGFFQALVVFAD